MKRFLNKTFLSILCSFFTSYSVIYILYFFSLYILYSILFTLHSLLCTLSSLLCTLYFSSVH
ncbi:hypothetical protein C7M59_02140 [Clostridium botulinum]|nr:hypothetical protein C7M59_02140 [Clostridium botulinum]